MTVSCFLHSQNSAKSDCRKEIELSLPLYVIDNYCSKTGLDDIVREASVDDRVSGIKTTGGITLSDSTIVIVYNSSMILFEKFPDVPYLRNFLVYFQTQQQMESFAQCYADVLEFEGVGITGSANAILMNYEPGYAIDGLPYSVTCFVNQWEYCGKNNSTSSSQLNYPTKKRGNVFWFDEWCTDSYSYTNSNNNIKIDGIIETETQTLVRLTATPSKEYDSGWWVNISPNAYILIDSNKYFLQEYGGIPLSPEKYYFSSINDKLSFTLYFEKAHIRRKTFDIIEGVEGGFNFYNIHKTK